MKREEYSDYINFTYYEMPSDERLKFYVGNIYDNKIQCKLCGWIIRSRNLHDHVKCKCGKISIDGGSWYQKIINPEYAINHVVYFKNLHPDEKI